MRTTIDLDEDILRVVKHLAQERQESFGKILSTLARQGLQPKISATAAHHGGIPVLARKAGARPVTAQIVKELQELEN
jgi:hypothetical protein